MRKMLVLFLAITMLFALSACQKEKPKPEFTLGDVDDLTYENEFLGMGFRLDKRWKLYPSNKIKDPQTVGKEQCAVYAAYTDDELRLWIYFEEMDEEKLQALDVKEYCGKILFTSSRVTGLHHISYENSYSDISVEIGERSVTGKFVNRYTNPDFWNRVEKIRYCEAVFAIKCDGYLAQIRLAASERSEILDIMDHFYILEE